MKYFEWDLIKNKANHKKHGVLFDEAIQVFDDPYILYWLDRRYEYGEDRWVALGAVESEILLIVVHTIRGNDDGEERIRIISARAASKSESRLYSSSYRVSEETIAEFV